ncbi:MAG: hypothetical protein ACI8RZ_002442 [Myxococcota bacterium]|jgi:hypothetical protein
MFLLFTQSASAFCGNYVGEAGAELVNTASEVAIVRQQNHTTITMASDFEADVSEFAVIIPVPVILTEEDVRVVDPSLFHTLDQYSGPRLVAYSCDELYPETSSGGGGLGCADYDLAVQATDDMAGSADDPYSDVAVEARFIVGEYEIVVLSAEESESLIGWLNDSGYAVSANAEAIMQEYLDAGSYFFAAKVDTDLIPADQDMLSPLSFSYESDVFSLPIRLGTVNSPGVQDLVIYALTDADAGRVAISNYDEAVAEDECLFRGESDFGDFYEERFSEAVGDEPEWVTEYGWYVTPWVSACDPCPPTEIAEPMDINDLTALGFVSADPENPQVEYYFTRLRMRYTPQKATEDLTLYISGLTENTQQRYVQYESYMESLFPICTEGWVEDDPGSCADEGREYRKRIREQEGGCAVVKPWNRTAGLTLVMMGLLGLVGMRRRR